MVISFLPQQLPLILSQLTHASTMVSALAILITRPEADRRAGGTVGRESLDLTCKSGLDTIAEGGIAIRAAEVLAGRTASYALPNGGKLLGDAGAERS
jgi:hypothetical protein